MKKKMLAILLIGVLSVCLAGCKAAKWNDGTFYGTGNGHGGPIKAEVVIEKGKITKVEAVEHQETPGIGDAALGKISEEVITSQTAEVDSVSGATITSQGFIEAINDALSQAAKK